MTNMRWLMNLLRESTDFDMDGDDAKARFDEPDFRRLSALLDIWGEGWAGPAWGSAKLHADLLAVRDTARQFGSLPRCELYRAFMPTPGQLAALARDGRFVIDTPPDRPLASWSQTEDGALEWITGFSSPWLVIEQSSERMDIFIDFVEASQEMNGYRPKYAEVIVVMPPRLLVTRDDITRMENMPTPAED